jgi:hypothetical protein
VLEYAGDNLDILKYHDQCVIIDRTLSSLISINSSGSDSSNNSNAPRHRKKRRPPPCYASMAVYPDIDTALFNIRKRHMTTDVIHSPS